VTGRHDGLPLTRGRLRIVRNQSRQHHAIAVTPRIGITAPPIGAEVPNRGLTMGLPLGLLLVLQQPIIVDGHIDTPQRMLDMKADITARLTDGHIDVPRMREAGSRPRSSRSGSTRAMPGTRFSARWT